MNTTNFNPTDWPQIWEAVSEILAETANPNLLKVWIAPLKFQSFQWNGDILQIDLVAPNEFGVNHIKRSGGKQRLIDALTQVLGSKIDLQLSHLSLDSDSNAENLDVLEPVSVDPEPMRIHESPAPLHSVRPRIDVVSSVECRLDPRYRFDNFIVGSSNQFAHAAAISVSENLTHQYNPLFLYSAPGLGKTHLLHAIGNHYLSRESAGRVGYLSAEKFVNELIEAIQHTKMPEFRRKYRESYDLLLIDDIQFIAGKSRSEEEFFHTFNEFHSSKRQIVMTSDRQPKDIPRLEERLRTRFEWGLIADIQPPEIETRIAILKAKAEREDIYLPDDVSNFLSTHIKSNVRELEGVLIRLQAHASLTGAEITLEMAKEQLRDLVPEESTHHTVEMIQNTVSKYFGLKVSDLKGNVRTKAIAEPRQIAMYLARKYTGMGFAEIGTHFGGKDHSTIQHGVRKIDRATQSDKRIGDAVESIQNLL